MREWNKPAVSELGVGQTELDYRAAGNDGGFLAVIDSEGNIVQNLGPTGGPSQP
jgi:hypothetical protein